MCEVGLPHQGLSSRRRSSVFIDILYRERIRHRPVKGRACRCRKYRLGRPCGSRISRFEIYSGRKLSVFVTDIPSNRPILSARYTRALIRNNLHTCIYIYPYICTFRNIAACLSMKVENVWRKFTIFFSMKSITPPCCNVLSSFL